MCLKIGNIWAKRGRKWGGEHMYAYKMKRFFTFHAVKVVDTLEERAKPFIRRFLAEHSVIEALKMKVRELNRLVEYMQRKLRDQLAVKGAKVEVLHNFWDKMTGNILQKAVSIRDEVGQGLIRKMIVVPRDVRDSVLRNFVGKCRARHTIAFFQWRLRFPSHIRHDHAALQTEIEGLLKQFVADDEAQDQVIGEETLKASKLSKDFIKKYRILDGAHGEAFPWGVNTFNQIGWDDPFPEDAKVGGTSEEIGSDITADTKYTDWTYPESRFVEGFGPYCIYVPRAELMLKIMRACINVKVPEDLWINAAYKLA